MTKVDESKAAVQLFKRQTAVYKQAIDEDIAAYVGHLQTSTQQQYGPKPYVAMEAYLNILQRGGKRLRGALTLLGYEMMGGTNSGMIIQAARAMEMIHAYILIIDDVQDRSAIRRGGPTVHHQLADYHRQQHFKANPEHFGESLALNAALLGNHAAHMILANLDADAQLRCNVISILSRTMLVTAHGQTIDILNQVTPKVTSAEIDQVQEWKTAHYSFLNPLHVGMVLAGADCRATDAITPYALHAGQAFQIINDINGIFGSTSQTGKDPMDDIKEGKHTLLIAHALANATPTDQAFLHKCLGNPNLTPKAFLRCQSILQASGALTNAQSQAHHHTTQAVVSLSAPHVSWTPSATQFLTGLALSLTAVK